MKAIGVLIVDDHRVFAEAIGSRLRAEPDIRVVGQAHTAAQALDAVETLDPDVVLMDVELGADDGIELTARLHASYPSLAILVVTFLADPVRAGQAIRAGASGWVTKDAPTEELLGAIRGVAVGESWIPPRLLTGVLRELLMTRRLVDEDEERLARLTPRERSVLEMMADGLDRSSIAERMFLSTNTIRTHVQNIFAKLHVRSSLEAVALALRVRSSRPVASASRGARLPR
ncbi:MAG: response regulator [Actinomycetota bacterium]